MDVKAQSSLEYLMTYGWALILISTVVGILAFVVMGPTDDFQCTVSEPTKFLLKGVDVPASSFDSLRQVWYTTSDSSEHTKMILQNITGGRITINMVEAFTDPACDYGKWDTIVTYDYWCPAWEAAHDAGETDPGWIDAAIAYGSFISNAGPTTTASSGMKINGVPQSLDDTSASGTSMCRAGATVEVGAGELIEITDFLVTPPNSCLYDERSSGNEPGMFRLNYTDQFGLSDNVVITCMGLPEKP